MDFAQRTSAPAPASAPAPNRASGSKKSNKKWSMLVRWASAIMLVSVGVLILAVIGSITLSHANQEAKLVDSGAYQAVFLNGGQNGTQVYFGKVASLNSRYVVLKDIYYLRVNQTVQPNQSTSATNDVSLVKLGCELHGPQDHMVINSNQVVFWENLKTDGQVAKAIAEYQKANPNGQDCTAAAAATTKK